MTVLVEKTNRETELVKWLDDFISNFRIEAAKLSQDERNAISNDTNYLAPCQVEVFWLEQPEFQVIVLSKFKDRSDKEVIVNGPYKGYEFIDKVENILKDSRWTKELPKNAPYVVLSQRDTFADVMLGILASDIPWISSTVFDKLERPSPLGGQAISLECWVGLFAGNINQCNQESMITEILKGAKSRVATAVKPIETRSQVASEEVDVTVGYFYPPIVVGEIPEPRTVRQYLARGRLIFTMGMRKVIEGTVGNYHLPLTKDGMMAVTTTNTSLAVRIFNLVLGLALLDGFDARAIRESETGQGRIDGTSHDLRSWGMSGSGPRTPIFYRLSEQDMSYSRTPIPEDRLSRIMERANRLFVHPQKTDELILWLESSTHFNDGEYAPSFVII